jgi:hypothetical protein
VIIGVQEAIRRAESRFKGVVIWHEAPFAFGANLKEVTEGLAAKNFDLLDEYVGEFQKASMCFKYAKVPVVAAVQGMALGGGCEFLMHCAKRVIALESYIGLVEAGVGLIPAGGGCKEFAIRAWRSTHAKTGGNDPFEFLQPVFDALVHFGTHGSQEWLPGKERGLSVYDPGMLAVGDLPVAYPYIADNIGEASRPSAGAAPSSSATRRRRSSPAGLHER